MVPFAASNAHICSRELLNNCLSTNQDLSRYLGPIIVVTSLASFLGFLSSSSVVDDNKALRTTVAMLSGLSGVVATTLTALRNAQKFDIKAEMFRSAAGQYRILATKLEQRIRLHRHILNEYEASSSSSSSSTNPDLECGDIKKEKEAFIKFFIQSCGFLTAHCISRYIGTF
jgi:hypothetical protein